jgi:hypothetical protein
VTGVQTCALPISLADATDPNGSRRKVSAEFGPAVIKAGKLVAGHAKLWGSALVAAGAFPSAQVLAEDTPDAPPAEEVTAEGEHIALEVPALPADITATTPAGDSAVYTPDAAPAEGNPTEGESNVTAVLAGAQVVPPTLAPVAPVTTQPRPVDLNQVYAAFATLRANPYDADATQVPAALTDIKISGSNALPASGVINPNWLGQLYDGVSYEREYINLGNLGTNITAGGKKGFKVKRGTSGSPIAGPDGIPNGGTWPGNKAEINSYNGFTSTGESFRRNFAVGNDIAREFYDLPGGAEVVEAFLKLFIEDYLYWSDMWALYDIGTSAGAPVAAETYPTDYPAALGQLIQGILAVKARKADGRRDVPTFAIANDVAYKELVYAAGGAEHLPEFVSIALSKIGRAHV